MPSEGKPLPIDTTVITTPDHVPTGDVELMADRRARHTAQLAGDGAGAPDALAALALGAAMRRVLDDQEQQLVREGLRRGASWEEIAAALGAAGPGPVRAAFGAWSAALPPPERAKAQRLVVTGDEWADAELLWDFHQMHHTPRPCSIAIGLGSHDLSIADVAVDAYEAGLVPRIVFTGANSPTTRERFPRGEAVHYREHALERGVPDTAVLVEPDATNTGQNITLSRTVLETAGVDVESVLLVCKPYEERRAYATARKLWPDVEIVCASAPMGLDEYVANIGDVQLVIDMLVGALQRLQLYPRQGFMVELPVAPDVTVAYERLVQAGYTSRLVPDDAHPTHG